MKPQISNLYPKALLFVPILLFCLTHLHAKDVEVEGFYIKRNGDTIRTKFFLPVYNVNKFDESNSEKNSDELYSKYTYSAEWLPNFKRIQWRISTTSDNENKLMPSDCSSFQFTYGPDTFRYISCPNWLFSKKNNYLYSYFPDSIFILVVISGPISLYQYYENKEIVDPTKKYPDYPGFHYNKLKYLLKKPEEQSFLPYNEKFFKKHIKEYIADSPSVLTKIEFGKYKASDIVEIIKDYNGSCMRKLH
ncbi:MAG TPA: hypothetical protein VHO72_03140 [Bacteroidales bacterium]|nr:hypothetical protein [Bacteroidales bacterium]